MLVLSLSPDTFCAVTNCHRLVSVPHILSFLWIDVSLLSKEPTACPPLPTHLPSRPEHNSTRVNASDRQRWVISNEMWAPGRVRCVWERLTGWLAGLVVWVEAGDNNNMCLQWLSGWMLAEWLAGWLSGWLDGWVPGWVTGWWLSGRLGVEWLDGWLNGWLGGRTHKLNAHGEKKKKTTLKYEKKTYTEIWEKKTHTQNIYKKKRRHKSKNTHTQIEKTHTFNSKKRTWK